MQDEGCIHLSFGGGTIVVPLDFTPTSVKSDLFELNPQLCGAGPASSATVTILGASLQITYNVTCNNAVLLWWANA